MHTRRYLTTRRELPETGSAGRAPVFQAAPTRWAGPGPLQKGQWLGGVELLATDGQHVLLYDGGLGPLGALSFVDRTVRRGWRARSCPTAGTCNPRLAVCLPWRCPRAHPAAASATAASDACWQPAPCWPCRRAPQQPMGTRGRACSLAC